MKIIVGFLGFAFLVFLVCCMIFVGLFVCRTSFESRALQKKAVKIFLLLIGVMFLFSGLEKTWFRIRHDKPRSIGVDDFFRGRDSPRHVELKGVKLDLLDTVFSTQYRKANITRAWFVIRSDPKLESEFQEIVVTEERTEILELLKTLVGKISELQSADELQGVRWVDLDSKWDFGSNSENHGLSGFEIVDESQIPSELERLRYVDCELSGVVLRGFHAKAIVKGSSWDVRSELRIHDKFVVIQKGNGPSVVVCATHLAIGIGLVVFSRHLAQLLLYLSRRIIDDPHG